MKRGAKDLIKTLGLVFGALLVGLLGFLPLGNVMVSGPVGLPDGMAVTLALSA